MKRDVVITGMGSSHPIGRKCISILGSACCGKGCRRSTGTIRYEWVSVSSGGHSIIASIRRNKAEGPQPFVARLASGYSSRTRSPWPGAGLLDPTNRSNLPILPLSVSTTAGGMTFGEDFLRNILARKHSRLLGSVARYLPDQQILDLQLALGFEGPTVIIANACASGANAIGHAAEMVSSGMADCVLTGGFEALTELVFVGFDCLHATTVDRCRPFDLNRSGLLLGEAAAFFVLETPEHARQRGVQPLCRLSGYGHGTDFFHLTQPQPYGETLIATMRSASESAGDCSSRNWLCQRAWNSHPD